uniref:Uncharacterized protein n=1 Tax=Avena sativa TaxID=4498 RepID=A0ACD5VQL0_AVESA
MGPHGRCFEAPWAWRIGEPDTWRRLLDVMGEMEGDANGGAGLGFSPRFDPMRAGFDPTLVSVPLSALISRLLGWSKKSSQGRKLPQGSAMVAAAVAVYFAALFLSDQQPRRPRRRRLPAYAVERPNSAARPRALPAPGDGLRFLSSNDEYSENVIHGASIGAGDEEPVLVARVPTMMPPHVAGSASSYGESEKEREEVDRFKEMWLSLVEREQKLELRLMDLDVLREQEATVRDLENRVGVAAVETRLLELKVSSLREENERLKAEASELDAVRAQLGRAKGKLRALKERVQVEREEAQREAAALRERVMELDREKELAAEAASLRKANAELEEENRELARMLQDAEHLSSSVSLVHQEDVLAGANYLREANERLTRQIEQLHSDHCAHVEELVYLKWVNACLRHDLRGNDHHPSSAQQDQDGAGAGMSSAMELSKSMSYRSSEKAKELMLRYGNLGLDPALFSPLDESLYGDGEDHQRRGAQDEPGRSPGVPAPTAAAAAEKRAGHGKLKFLKNIKKLLASSKRGHGHDRKSIKAPNDEHVEKALRWLSSSHDALGGDSSYESTPLSSCDRTPLSSVTTVDSRARAVAGLEAETRLVRSKSDVGASFGREGSRYQALRPDRPRSTRLTR